MDTLILEGRYPAGVVLVDKPAGKVWIYDWDGAFFVVREPEGHVLDRGKRWVAAEGNQWEVRAAPWVGANG